MDPEHDVACAPTCSRLAHQVDRQALYRLPTTCVDPLSASSPEPPAASVLALDHADDPTPGQHEFAFSNHYSKNSCDLPLFLFAGTSPTLVTASRRPGPRPPGAAKAMIVVRLLSSLRRHWPHTPLLVRGARPCATPAVIDVLTSSRGTEVVLGLAGQAVWLRLPAPVLHAARRRQPQRGALAPARGAAPPASRRLSAEGTSAALPWAPRWRGGLKAEGLSAGDPHALASPRLTLPRPRWSMQTSLVPGGMATTRAKRCPVLGTVSAPLRPPAWPRPGVGFRACAASALPHALRTSPRQHTALAHAQPSTGILPLCPIAPPIKQDNARRRRHLPSACPVKALFPRVTTLLSVVPERTCNTS